MNPLFCIVLIALFGAASAVAQIRELPPKSKRWALVIGVDRYDNPQIGRLEGASTDAKSLRDALVDTAGFPDDQIIVIASDEPKERQPTRVNILMAMSNLMEVIPRDGLLLLAFSGHGIERQNQAYLLPSDAYIHNNVAFLAETAIRLSWIQERIRDRRVAQVLLLLDACRNDPGGRADAPNPLTEAYTKALSFDTKNKEVSAFATIYATAIGERAYEYTERRQGYFTWAVVDGLRGAAANDRGEVTLRSLVSYVQEAVPKRVAIDLGGGRKQRPFSHVEGFRADDLVLAYGTVNTKELSSSPTVPPSPYLSVDPKAIELKVWEAADRLNTPAAYEEYLRQYPNGTWSNLARLNLKATTLISGNADDLLAAAENAYDSGNYGEARRILATATAAGDADAQARLGSLSFLCLGGPCDLPQATRLLEDATKRGSVKAEAWLALMWILRRGDYERAVKLARLATDRGDLIGVIALASAYEEGHGVAVDEKEADRLYRLAVPGLRERAQRGDPFSQNALGRIYHNGLGGIPTNVPQAVDWFRRGADRLYAVSQVNLASMYETGEGGLPKNDAKAVEYYRKAADQGNSDGQFRLGRMFEEGRGGLAKSDLDAAVWYRKAADNGHTDAMNNLGSMYKEGRGGVPKDNQKALEFYRKAADNGNLTATTNLGVFYENGEAGLQRDSVKAVDLYRKAADRGHTRAQAYLASMYQTGDGGLPKDEARAAELYVKAADQGDSYAQAGLAKMYEHGAGGLPKDINKAIELYRKAADQGNAWAKTALARLEQ